MRTVLAVAAFALAAGAALAQPGPVAPPPPAPLPPGQAVSNTLPVGGDEPAALPGGKDVSQPLQPVGPAPAEPKEPAPVVVSEVKPAPAECRVPHGPLGPSWSDYALLYWWPLRAPVPALVYGTRGGLPPVPGAPGTLLLAGGHAIDSQPSAGGRFTLGRALNTEETLGWEATYLFLGTRSFRQYVPGEVAGVTNFGLPYTNAATGANEVLALAGPGGISSALVLSTNVRVQGWEVNGVANVVDEKCVKLNALVGWRYFQVNEGLRLAQSQFRAVGPGGIVQTADQFDTQNRFNGGQLGLHADVQRGLVFCEMTGKIAFGQTYEVVRTGGQTNFLTPGLFGPVTQPFVGSGIFVQPSNAGRTANGVFAVVPEGTVKFGLRLGDAGRLYVGYSFIYLSDAVRPGDQIDRTLNPAQVHLVSGAGPVYGGTSPARPFNRSDFWVQGLVIGLETRY
jgi:hypothetical protein